MTDPHGACVIEAAVSAEYLLIDNLSDQATNDLAVKTGLAQHHSGLLDTVLSGVRVYSGTASTADDATAIRAMQQDIDKNCTSHHDPTLSDLEWAELSTLVANTLPVGDQKLLAAVHTWSPEHLPVLPPTPTSGDPVGTLPPSGNTAYDAGSAYGQQLVKAGPVPDPQQACSDGYTQRPPNQANLDRTQWLQGCTDGILSAAGA